MWPASNGENIKNKNRGRLETVSQTTERWQVGRVTMGMMEKNNFTENSKV